MASTIIKVYADKIYYHRINDKTGKEWCIEDVPERYRAEVQAELDKRG